MYARKYALDRGLSNGGQVSLFSSHHDSRAPSGFDVSLALLLLDASLPSSMRQRSFRIFLASRNVFLLKVGCIFPPAIPGLFLFPNHTHGCDRVWDVALRPRGRILWVDNRWVSEVSGTAWWNEVLRGESSPARRSGIHRRRCTAWRDE